MPKYFKITSPDGTSFYDSKTKYVAGKTVRKKVREKLRSMADGICMDGETERQYHCMRMVSDEIYQIILFF